MEEHVRERADRPFALALSWGPPHWPYDQYPDAYDIYVPETVDLPPNVPEQFAAFARREIAHYYGNVTALDAQFGRLDDALERLGIRNDTLVVFTSDHGDHLSSHGYGKPMDRWMHPSFRASKATPYEESIHVPFIARLPGRIASGTRSDALVSSVDMMPTLLGMAGVPVPGGVQGHRSVSRADRDARTGQRFGLSSDPGSRLAAPGRVGRLLARDSHRPLGLRALARKTTGHPALRPAGRSLRDEESGRRPRLPGDSGGLRNNATTLDDRNRRSLRHRTPRSERRACCCWASGSITKCTNKEDPGHDDFLLHLGTGGIGSGRVDGDRTDGTAPHRSPPLRFQVRRIPTLDLGPGAHAHMHGNGFRDAGRRGARRGGRRCQGRGHRTYPARPRIRP